MAPSARLPAVKGANTGLVTVGARGVLAPRPKTKPLSRQQVSGVVTLAISLESDMLLVHVQDIPFKTLVDPARTWFAQM